VSTHRDGNGAISFRRDYLEQLKAKVPPQSELAVALAYALGAHKETRERMHNNIWDIGQKTLTALDSLHACHSPVSTSRSRRSATSSARSGARSRQTVSPCPAHGSDEGGP
jgi:hypothetical protein